MAPVMCWPSGEGGPAAASAVRKNSARVRGGALQGVRQPTLCQRTTNMPTTSATSLHSQAHATFVDFQVGWEARIGTSWTRKAGQGCKGLMHIKRSLFRFTGASETDITLCCWPACKATWCMKHRKGNISNLSSSQAIQR
eukprot:1154873-Pelagomonas_calceolata.AAC.2